MAKISKPMQWILILAVVGGAAAYLFTEQEAGPRRTARNTATKKSVVLPGFTEADMTASFTRLSVPLRDAFVPKVVVKKPALGVVVNGGLPVAKPTWALTGIYVYNGVKLALLENAATGESQSVKAGQVWMGQQILSVTAKGILLANGTQMIFEEPAEETPTGVTPVLLSGGAAPTPGTGPLTLNLPPRVAPTQPTGTRP